jgi:hypothetical protein
MIGSELRNVEVRGLRQDVADLQRHPVALHERYLARRGRLSKDADLFIQLSRSLKRYRTARPIRTKAGPDPFIRRLARVDFEVRRYDAASLGVRYFSLVMVSP